MIFSGNIVVNLNVALVSVVSLKDCIGGRAKTVPQWSPNRHGVQRTCNQSGKGRIQHAGQVVARERAPRPRRENVACYAGSAAGSRGTRVHQLGWKKRKITLGFGL